jgi:hypothetical protein
MPIRLIALPLSLQREKNMGFEQRGWVVVSYAGELPVMHSFHMPEWEAKLALAAAKRLPAHLTDSLQMVPATLRFESIK